MFTNLIESNSHVREFKRRSSFFLATIAAYALIIFAAGVASIYAYDAQLEAQTSGLEVLNWVPPVVTEPARQPHDTRQPLRRTTPSNAPIDRHITVPIRTEGITRTDDPTKIPTDVGVKASPIPPVTGIFRRGNTNADPLPTTNIPDRCITCNAPPIVEVKDPPPAPKPPKPTTEKLPSIVLISKAVSLPQPPYPTMAKQAHVQGSVNIQILVDEQGKVVSAQVVSGNPMLNTAARDAALRARFTPTVLNGQAIKVQGVITYNFVLQ